MDNTKLTILSVSQLNRQARELLEGHFPMLRVDGEISNLATPTSGHWYFTLKDSKAQIRCAMFRNRNQIVRFVPRNGLQVLVKGKLSLYEGRGDYQLILDNMEETGDGALRRAFEQLKNNLFAEGLFETQYKQEIPDLPKHIAVVTSPTGAAIRDILSVLKRRFPAIAVTIIPVAVQGETAALAIANAIELANRVKHRADVLIVGRGGGSLEDLQAFNEEGVARAIFKSEIPVVSAVGHEIDFTIADLVADIRAATPSAAAELLSPDREDYQQLFLGYQQQFITLMQQQINQHRQQLLFLSQRVKHPGRRLQENTQRLDELEKRLGNAIYKKFQQTRTEVKSAYNALLANNPGNLIKQILLKQTHLSQRLHTGLRQTLHNHQQQIVQLGHRLNTVSPLNTLGRGYTITYTHTHKDGTQKVIRDASQLDPGTKITTQLHKGKLFSTVDKIEIDSNNS